MTETERPGGVARRVRPYALVAGRTQPSVDMPAETLARITGEGAEKVRGLTLERREIASICGDPISIVEISAHVGVPLVVARVLVDDMAAEGLLQCRLPTSADLERPNLQLLERVLDGLQRL